MDQAEFDSLVQRVNFAAETAALSMQLLLKLLPILQQNAGVSNEAAEIIHSCLLRLENVAEAFSPEDLARMQQWRRMLSDETD